MYIKITPLDTVFFRTGRPFRAGEDTWAEVVFPPPPSTVYGAIRSFMISKRGSLKDFYDGKHKEDLGTYIENERKVVNGILKITGPLLYKEKLWFKSPLDLVLLNDKELIPLKLSKKPPLVISEYNLNYMLIWKNYQKAEEAKGWLSIIDFCNYLKNEDKSYLFLENKDLFNYEHKVGIKRNSKTFTSEDGFLYRIPLIRMDEDTHLVIRVDGVNDLPEKGIIQLGGESKAASFQKIDDPLRELKVINLNFENRLFKLYIATPAIFKKGWFPEWIDESNFEGSYNGIKLKLLGCAVGKPIYIGGWDIAGVRAKPMRKAVPPGSVYYFEILKGDKDKIKEIFHLQNISDINLEEGLGLAIVGEVKL